MNPTTTGVTAALSCFLDGRDGGIRNRVRALLSQPDMGGPPGLEINAHRRWVLDHLRLLSRQGLGRLALPRTYGGEDDPAAYLAAFETLGYGDLSLVVAFGVQFGLFVGSILGLGTGVHHRRFLAEAGRLELAGCFAMTETDHGSNVGDLQTVARYDRADDTFVVHTPHPGAAKDYIGGAVDARAAIVFARLVVNGDDHGVHPLIVELRDVDGRPLPGRCIEDRGPKAGLHGVGIGRITFSDVRVPREALLDRFGGVDATGQYTGPLGTTGERFAATLGTLLPGRVAVAAAAVAASKTALTVAIRYGERRRQFAPEGQPEQPILDYLSHQRRLIPAVATTYALHFAVGHAGEAALDAFDEGRTGDDRRRVDAVVAGIKATATWHAVATAQECREACGGRGYLADMRLGAIRADVDVFTTFEGDNTVLLQLAARSLLTDFAAEFKGASWRDVAGHLLRPLAARRGAVGGAGRRVGDIGFQVDALRWRERQLLAEVGRRVKRRTDRGDGADTAFLANQDGAIEVALAHTERVILEHFAAAVAVCPDECRPVLTQLCRLYGLIRMEAAAAWFLERHYVSSAAARRLRPAINGLCLDLKPHVRALVDAFAVPEALLGSSGENAAAPGRQP